MHTKNQYLRDYCMKTLVHVLTSQVFHHRLDQDSASQCPLLHCHHLGYHLKKPKNTDNLIFLKYYFYCMMFFYIIDNQGQ